MRFTCVGHSWQVVNVGYAGIMLGMGVGRVGRRRGEDGSRAGERGEPGLEICHKGRKGGQNASASAGLEA